MSSTSSSSSSAAAVATTQNPLRKLTRTYPIISRTDLELGAQLGYGAYGTVFEGFWRQNSNSEPKKVAVKKVFVLEREAEILSQIRHRNIIQFYGVSYATPDFFIVTEFAEGGTLFDRIHGNDEEAPDFQQILKWATQIANGVAYMHYEAPEPIIHRDLKTKNILLCTKNECKICDFGTSKNLTRSWTAPTWGGTAAWMSPEMIAQKGGITPATDVWSYGIVLWELVHREIPYDGLTEFRIYTTIALHGVRLVIADHCPPSLAGVMRNCWRTKPEDRYDMKQVVAILQAVTDSDDFAIQYELFMAHRKEWKAEIEKQRRELELLRIDYAKRLEELDARENALKIREQNQVSGSPATAALLEDVYEWNEAQVCQWIRHIGPSLYISETLLNDLISLVGRNNINGKRLLDMTLNDWKILGVSSFGVRLSLCREIEKLDTIYNRSKNFPTLQTAQLIVEHKRLQMKTPPIATYINIGVILYSRICPSWDNGKSTVRFKVLVDTDWDFINATQDLPTSHSMIKNIIIVTKFDDKDASVQTCIMAPFVLMDWISAPTLFERLKVECDVCFGDCVIRPRTTRVKAILHEITDLMKLSTTKVKLLLKPCSNVIPDVPVNEGIAGRSVKRLYSLPGGSDTSNNVWHDRATSADSALKRATVADTPTSSGLTVPIWVNDSSSCLDQELSSLVISNSNMNRDDTSQTDSPVNCSRRRDGGGHAAFTCIRKRFKRHRPLPLIYSKPQRSRIPFRANRCKHT